jgi:NAD(P)-dependent dehydrogenase (short-subunit alcohol dehydrogenase family)
VIAGCRNPAAATELAELTASVHAVDMGDERSITAFVEAIGDQTVDIVINNAGIDARNLGAADSERDVLTQAPAQLMGQIEVNAVGPWLLSRSLLPQLRRSDHARIVNITSQIGSMEVSQRIGRDVGYAVSKAALNMITVKLAVRLRDEGIIAVLIHPGFLRTDMGGSAATMGPDDSAREIAKTVDHLTIEDTGTFRRWDGTVHPW